MEALKAEEDARERKIVEEREAKTRRETAIREVLGLRPRVEVTDITSDEDLLDYLRREYQSRLVDSLVQARVRLRTRTPTVEVRVPTMLNVEPPRTGIRFNSRMELEVEHPILRKNFVRPVARTLPIRGEPEPEESEEEGEPEPKAKPSVKPSRSYRVGCWNCGDTSHRYNDCQRDIQVFCFNCGMSGYRVVDCPNCGEEYREKGPFTKRRRNLVESPTPSEPVEYPESSEIVEYPEVKDDTSSPWMAYEY